MLCLKLPACATTHQNAFQTDSGEGKKKERRSCAGRKEDGTRAAHRKVWAWADFLAVVFSCCTSQLLLPEKVT